MYVSVLLDKTERRHPTCTQNGLGVAKIIQKVAHITRVIDHMVAYINSQVFSMTPLRQERLSKVL